MILSCVGSSPPPQVLQKTAAHTTESLKSSPRLVREHGCALSPSINALIDWRLLPLLTRVGTLSVCVGILQVQSRAGMEENDNIL